MDAYYLRNVKSKDWVQFTALSAASWVVKYISAVKKNYNVHLQSTQWLRSSKFSIKELHNFLRYQGAKVPWQGHFWIRLSVPKHKVILWLTSNNKLNTKARLIKIGVIQDNLYPTCSVCEEIVPHLFFECPFNKECMLAILIWLGFTHSKFAINSLLPWIHIYCKRMNNL